MILDEWRDQLVAQTKIQRQLRREFPAILCEVAGLPVVDVHRRTRRIDVRNARWRAPHQEVGERAGTGPGVSHGTTRVAAVDCETVDGGITDEVGACLQTVLAKDPGECVTKGDQVLVEWSIRIATAISECCKSSAKVNCRMSIG